MERQAFARARRFLNYLPIAKWTALIAAVGAGVMFVALLGTLGLFVDLLVHRGEIPTFSQLPRRLQHSYQEMLPVPAGASTGKVSVESHVKLGLAGLGLSAEEAQHLIRRVDIRSLDSERSREILWLFLVPQVIQGKVGDEAARVVREELRSHVVNLGLEAAAREPLRDLGVLSLVVRTEGTVQGAVVAPMARVNEWMWRYGNHYYLQGLGLLALALAAVRAAVVFAGSYLAARATIEAVTRLRRAIYHHTHRLGALAVRALGPSEAVSVSTRHLEVVHDGLYAWLTVSFREPTKFVLVLALAMLLHFWLTVAFLMFAFLVWVLGGQIAAHFRRQGRVAEHRAAENMALIQESLMMMRLVKVYLMEPFNQARLERQLSGNAAAQLQRYRGEALYRPLLALLGFFAGALLLLLAGTVILDGQLGLPSALVITTSLACLFWPLVKLLDARRVLRRARHAAKVLFDFLDRPGSVGQAVEAEFLPPMARALEFDRVTLLEPGTGRKLLRGVSLTIRAGQKVALVGPDDMEKHALLYLIPRFLDPRDGEVRIDGKNLRWVTLDSLRAQAAIVLQHNLVFNDTVANNIGCGDPGYNVQRIIQAAKIAHVHHFIQRLPHGYETVIGDMGHALGAGEKFRIALARAILREPALLIIEEPLVPLDDDTKAMVDDTYGRVLPGRTVIFLPHRLSTIKSCDQVLLLFQGRIEAAGEHRELVTTNELYRHLQYLEFNEFAGVTPQPAPAGGAA